MSGSDLEPETEFFSIYTTIEISCPPLLVLGRNVKRRRPPGRELVVLQSGQSPRFQGASPLNKGSMLSSSTGTTRTSVARAQRSSSNIAQITASQ